MALLQTVKTFLSSQRPINCADEYLSKCCTYFIQISSQVVMKLMSDTSRTNLEAILDIISASVKDDMLSCVLQSSSKEQFSQLYNYNLEVAFMLASRLQLLTCDPARYIYLYINIQSYIHTGIYVLYKYYNLTTL